MGADLIDLARAKRFLGLSEGETASDAILGELITEASTRFREETGREILQTSRREILDGNGETSILLSDYPVVSVQSLYVAGEVVYPVLPLHVATIPSTPYQIAVSYSGLTWAEDVAVELDGVPATKVGGAPAAGQYAVAAGTYTFAAADAGKVASITWLPTRGLGASGFLLDTDTGQIDLQGQTFTAGLRNVRVQYLAGWATAPADIQQAVCEMVAIRYRDRDHVGQVYRLAAGETNDWRGTSGALAYTQGVIERYRRPVIG